jgi:hypothetical protein
LDCFDGTGHGVGLAPGDTFEHCTVNSTRGNCVEPTVRSWTQGDVCRGLEELGHMLDGHRGRVATYDDYAVVTGGQADVEGVNHF